MIEINKCGIDFKYLIVNDLDKTFGLWVNTLGFQSIKKDSPYPVIDHPSNYFFNKHKGRILREYQLLYITKGEGSFESESIKRTRVEKGSLIILFPEQWHTYSPKQAVGWDEYYIGFQGPIINNIIDNHFLTKEMPILQVGFNEGLVNLFIRAITLAKEDKTSAQQYLAGVVLHILGKVIAMSRNKPFEDSEMHQKIERAKIIMNENVTKRISPDDIAQSLNISYSWFRKNFKEYTGYSPAQYYQELKLNKAKLLLTETDLSIKEIAYMLDFNSTEHFFYIFKRKTKQTPSEYRNNVRPTAILT